MPAVFTLTILYKKKKKKVNLFFSKTTMFSLLWYSKHLKLLQSFRITVIITLNLWISGFKGVRSKPLLQEPLGNRAPTPASAIRGRDAVMGKSVHSYLILCPGENGKDDGRVQGPFLGMRLHVISCPQTTWLLEFALNMETSLISKSALILRKPNYY